MNVSVFGLGYVGSVSAASFAADGHTVVGVDVNADKVASLNEGRSPIVEQGLDELIRDSAANGRLRATTEHGGGGRRHRPVALCVGTPSRRTAASISRYLERVCEQIGEALKDKADYHVVVVRSTVLPGTTHERRDPGARADLGQEIRRRLRRDGESRVPARGHGDQGLPPSAADARRPQLRSPTPQPTEALYAKVEAPLVTTSIRTAEMMKYASNTWHALKVCFANEIGNLCKRARHRQPRGDGHLLPGREAEPVVVLPEAGLRVRRFVPAEGRARAAVPRQGSRPRHAGHPGDPRQQPAADPARARPDRRDRQEAGRPARLQLQGRHRRPAREPDRHPRRGAARQGLLAVASTTGTCRSRGWSARTRNTSTSRSRTSRRCSASRSTR